MTTTDLAAPSTDHRPSGPFRTSLLWGDLAAVGAAAAVGLLALPFRPDSSDGWAELGWLLLTFAAAALAALLAGAVGIFVGLRRAGHDRALATALVFLPVALLAASVTAGVGALVAPAVSRWLVDGFAARGAGRAGARVGRSGPVHPHPVAGYGPPELQPRAGVVAPSAAPGLWQRLAVTAVGCLLLTWWTLGELGHRLGGEVRGEYLVWAACLPALVVVPALLLRRVLSATVIAGAVVVAAGLTAMAVPGAVAGAHPTSARLHQLAGEVPVPAGQRVVDEVDAVVEWSPGADPLPVTVLLSAPPGRPAPGVPPPLRPDTSGRLPDAAAGVLVVGVPASAAGQEAADAWERALLDEGWEVDELSVPTPYDDRTSGPYWLPTPAAQLIGAQQRLRYSDGPWVRADVVPYGDGALVVVSTRP